MKSAFLALTLAALIFASNAYSFSEGQLEKIEDGVYARIVSPDGNAVANAGVVVLEHSVLVFDTHFTPEAGRELLKQIRAVTPKSVRFVVNSHFHPDHTHGNSFFPEAQIIGSAATRRDISDIDIASMNRTIAIAKDQLSELRRAITKNADPTQLQKTRELIRAREEYLASVSNLKIIPPSMTLEDSLVIYDGDSEAVLKHFGAGHTDGDTVLYLPGKKVIFLGDLFFSKAIPNVQDAHMLEWIQTLKEALKLDAAKFIPGHGSVGTRKDVEAFLMYLEEIRSLAEEAIARGDSMEQATQSIKMPQKYAAYRFQDFFPANIQKMYAELKAEIQKKEAEKSEKE
jgi:glyoxylase-like metal-dependent hydrolase (beta-lactamase superfamily II)